MAEFSSHQPGTFSWPELATTDQNAGVAFYRALLGWGLREQSMGPEGTYSMFLLRDKEVGAACSLRPDEQQAGIPPHWNLYVTVASADDTARRATELGGRVLAPPFDVMDVGRMAVIQDPTGAVFEIWEPKRHIGARILSEPGALCWSELTTRDTAAAKAFYTKLLGWTAKESSADAGGMEYTEFSNQGQPGVGMMAMPAQMPAHVPSYWMPYFQVSDVDASAAQATTLGATVMVGPQDISKTGRFAILTDPQGAMFAIFARPAS
jgi:predicted enzyme related to lactoylglutathione lyase